MWRDVLCGTRRRAPAGAGGRVPGRTRCGFSLLELLVTVVLATIVLGAMVPLFTTVLKRTAGDNRRNVATNIAQDRIEQVRLLSYDAITQTNLNSPSSSSFGDGKFGSDYYVAGNSKPYNVTYVVNTIGNEKTVQVTVKWSSSDYATVTQTVENDPTPNVASSVSAVASPSPTISGLSITVSFKNWSEVTSQGVTVQRVQTNVTPNVTVTPTPTKRVPNASSTTVTWTGLTGGSAYIYTVTCHSSYITSTSPQFHLLQNARLKFDTNPGGS